MKQTILLLITTLILSLSCKQKKAEESQIAENSVKQDTTKLYQKISDKYLDENKITSVYEFYVSKKKDTFWNQWRYYKNGVIDSSKSKFYEFEIGGNKNDSILNGRISFFSPADSIPKSKINSRNVTFIYLQKENDSLIFKEIKTDKNVIHFDYKNFDNLSFVGYISDYRFIEIDSMPEKFLLNRNDFAIDSEISTNNPFIELLD